MLFRRAHRPRGSPEVGLGRSERGRGGQGLGKGARSLGGGVRRLGERRGELCEGLNGNGGLQADVFLLGDAQGTLGQGQALQRRYLGDLGIEEWPRDGRQEASVPRRQSPWEPRPLLASLHDPRLDLPLQPLEVVRALRAVAVAAGRFHAMPREGQRRLQRV